MNISDYTTYQAGILQARAYRNLKKFMNEHLQPFGVTKMEWSILGLAYDATPHGGIKVGALATNLDVEMSLVTNMLNPLESRGLIMRVVNPTDKRSKHVVTTTAGEKLIIKIEKILRVEMKEWLSEVPHDQLSDYVEVLKIISAKSE